MTKRAWIAGALVLAAVAVSLGFFWPFGGNHKQLRVPGTVEVFEIRLGSKVGGRVAQVYCHEGEEVEAGRELLRFESPELDAQKQQLEQRLAAARQEYQKAKDGPRPQERAAARAAWEAAKARRDRMEAGWRKEEKAQAENDLKAAQADLEYAREEFERIKKIRGQVSPSEYDAARSRQLTTTEKHNSAKARVEMLTEGNREEDKREAKALEEQARANYELMQEGTRKEDIAIAEAQVKVLEAKLRELEANLNETVVRAPARLVVEVLAVRRGDLVPPNQPVIRALGAEERWVKVFVPSTELGKIAVGDAVEVTNDSYPGRRFKGSIIQIATVSEFTPRNVQSLDERRNQVFGVKVRVDDGGDVFKAGMAAEVILSLKK